MHGRAAKWLGVAVWCGVIFAGSSLPGSRVPGRFGPVAHFTEYAILGALLVVALAAGRTKRSSLLLAVMLSSLYAMTDEFHQAFVPMRTPDPVDWLVDTAGAAAGAGMLVALARRRTKTATDQ